MTHEPECEHYVYEIHKPRPSSCMLCLIAREAYMRGREDVDNAQLVRKLRNNDNRMDGERA